MLESVTSVIFEAIVISSKGEKLTYVRGMLFSRLVGYFEGGRMLECLGGREGLEDVTEGIFEAILISYKVLKLK